MAEVKLQIPDGVVDECIAALCLGRPPSPALAKRNLINYIKGLVLAERRRNDTHTNDIDIT